MKQIVTVQYLRALAAAGVVVFHAEDGRFPIGQFGVDIFFVISGFIMWVLTHDRERDVRSFAVSRIARIVPTYWIVTLVMLAGWLVAPTIFLAKDPSLLRLVTALTFIPLGTWPIVLQGWTLNVEVFFYAAFAATLLLGRARQIVVLSTVFVLLVAVGGGREGSLFTTYMNPRLLEFIGGLWLGQVWLRGWRPHFAISVAALLGGLAVAFVASLYNGYPVWIWNVASLLVVGGGVFLDERAPHIRALRTAGDASYLVYLVHTPIVAAVRTMLPVPTAFQAIVAVALTFLIAWRLLPAERRVVQWTKALLTRRARPPVLVKS